MKLRIVATILGAILIITGIGLFSIPAGLIAAGLVSAGWGLFNDTE